MLQVDLLGNALPTEGMAAPSDGGLGHSAQADAAVQLLEDWVDVYFDLGFAGLPLHFV